MFKRIYVEISNVCNLSCSFCKNDKRDKRVLNLDEIELIFKRISNHTKYIYLHVKGEPLLHKDFDKIIDLAYKYDLFVNITTNGTLIKEKIDILINHKAIRQINISLHSLDKKYLPHIIELIKKNQNKYIQLRFWVDNLLSNYNYNYLINEFNNTNKEIYKKTFISKEEEFNWPNIDDEYISNEGTCLSGKMHLAILSNGIVSPCCLDSDGIINLGNILENDLDKIINSKRFVDFINGLNDNKLVEDLCSKCLYRR